MIAKVSTGRSFGGAVRYLHEGHKNEQVDKRARLLDYNGIRPGMEEMIKDFNRHRWLNPDLGNAVGHISLSYHQQDTAKLSDARMIQHAREVMSRLGMNPDETQFALIRHNDRDHQHCHLLYNRIDYNGCTISDQFSRSRAKEAATIIARQEGLTVAADKKKDLSLTHRTNLPGHDQARYEIYEAIQKELPQATSIDELRSALKTHQIETILQKGGRGMTFRFKGHPIKASAVDRSYSGGKIHEALEHNREVKHSVVTTLSKPSASVQPADKPITIKGYTLTSEEKTQLIAGNTLCLQLMGDDDKPYSAEVRREGKMIRVDRVKPIQTPPPPQPRPTPPVKERPFIIKGYALTGEEKTRLLKGDMLRLWLIGSDQKPYSADVRQEGEMIRIDRVVPTPVPQPEPAPAVKEKPFIIKGYELTKEEKTQLLGGATLRLRLMGDDGKLFSANVKTDGAQFDIQRVKPVLNPALPITPMPPATPPLSLVSPTESTAPNASAAEKEKPIMLPTPPTWHAKALIEYTRLGGRVLALQYNGFTVEPFRVNGAVTDYLLRPHGSPAHTAVKLSELVASQPINPKLKVNKGPKLR